jgi:hypothetical protein
VPTGHDPAGRILAQDFSRCITCGDPGEATVLERAGKIYQRNRCQTHETEHLILPTVASTKLEWSAGSSRNVAVSDEDEDKAPLLAVIDLTNRQPAPCLLSRTSPAATATS